MLIIATDRGEIWLLINLSEYNTSSRSFQTMTSPVSTTRVSNLFFKAWIWSQTPPQERDKLSIRMSIWIREMFFLLWSQSGMNQTPGVSRWDLSSIKGSFHQDRPTPKVPHGSSSGVRFVFDDGHCNIEIENVPRFLINQNLQIWRNSAEVNICKQPSIFQYDVAAKWNLIFNIFPLRQKNMGRCINCWSSRFLDLL